MRIKVDENIGSSGVAILTQGGHDAMTVREQGLAGSTDEDVFQVCVAERRILVTMDRDFGHVTRFPPKQTAGIVILELGGPASLRQVHDPWVTFFRSRRPAQSAVSCGSSSPAG